MAIKYLTIDEIVGINKAVVQSSHVNDVFQVKNPSSLVRVDNKVKAVHRYKNYSDLVIKAATLLQKLVKVHAFASANRRTTLISVLKFLKINYTYLDMTQDELTHLVYIANSKDNNVGVLFELAELINNSIKMEMINAN